MAEEKSQQQQAGGSPAPAAASGTATAPAPAAAAAAGPVKPAPAAKPEAPSPSPAQMISPALRHFLETRVKSGEPVTIEVKKEVFTGRIFRLMLHEGWIALEHADGRRRPFWVIEGGRIMARSGESIELPGGHGK